jgi:hypothetical protein
LEITYHEEGVLDGGSVAHGAEEVFAERQDHELLKETITEHELLGGARNVSVVVHDAHACESGDLDLKGDMRRQIDVGLGLFSGEDAGVGSSCEGSTEGFVPNLIDHCLSINYNF